MISTNKFFILPLDKRSRCAGGARRPPLLSRGAVWCRSASPRIYNYQNPWLERSSITQTLLALLVKKVPLIILFVFA